MINFELHGLTTFAGLADAFPAPSAAAGVASGEDEP